MRERRLGPVREFRNDALGERFAELDAPLIERVDPPDRALSEDDVLIKRDKLAERSGRQTLAPVVRLGKECTHPRRQPA